MPGRASTPVRRFDLPVDALTAAIVTSTKHKPEAHPLATRLAERLAGHGVDVTLDLSGEARLASALRSAQIVFSVGGDGTLLAAARRTVGSGVPVMGVNLGKLGFLAEFGADEAMAYVSGEAVPDWPVQEKTMLEVRVRGREGVYHALNDIMLSQGVMTRLVGVRMRVDGRPATEYRADGVVVSTPVGSTAYSLSLGGPILDHGLHALVVTPVAPHSFTNRPIVLAGDCVIGLEILTRTDEIALVVDGQQDVPVGVGDEILVTAAPRGLTLLSTGLRSAFDVLRLKLGWGTGPRPLTEEP